jgi:hypothetical protein
MPINALAGRRSLRTIAATFAITSLLVAGAGSRTSLLADSNHDNDKNTLKGSWDITITTTPNPPFAVPFRILRTVTGTGVVDAYAFPPITPTAGALINSSGHGSWKKVDGHRHFTVVVKYFQLNPATPLAVLDSIGTVTENITMSADGNSYSSFFLTEIALPDGTVIIQNSGSTTATRIQP